MPLSQSRKMVAAWPVDLAKSHVDPLSLILTEMFFRIRAESFGPLVERVFQCAGDDGCGGWIMLGEDRAVVTS